MDFYSRNGVVWGRRRPQLEFSLDLPYLMGVGVDYVCSVIFSLEAIIQPLSKHLHVDFDFAEFGAAALHASEQLVVSTNTGQHQVHVVPRLV